MAADGSTAADEDAGAAAAGGTEPAPDEPTSTTAAAAAAAAAATTDEAGAAAAASDTPPPGVPFSAGAPGAAAETTAPAPAAGDCCEALEKECLACAADMPVDRFCQMNMGRYGCPESPAWASDLEREMMDIPQDGAEREMMDIPQDGAEREMMDIPQETTSHTTGSNRCCEDLEDRRCLACVNRISVEELCDMFPNRYGCSNRGEVTAIVTDGAARLFAADGPQPRGSPAPPPPAVGAATALVPAVAAMAAAAAVARLHRCVAAPPERPPEAEAQGLIAVENEV
ncbi:unnamed protein product [Prorocentrum cordatum]|uniref:Uncharacterized protein n=1 Tax=Prorocentrum cordatum TaxID=2364126 RepID=A0ABN9QTE7_9DINO|nr:unnamed protein product [Polarella glacialis]